MIEPAPSSGGFDADGPGAEPVVIPKSLFQGSVNKKMEVAGIEPASGELAIAYLQV